MGTLLYLIGIACAVWVLYDVWAVNRTLTDTGKIVWSILAIIFNILTAIIYYMMVKKR
jgi:prolipoprotein diacylglyceryltransferase